MQESGNLVAPRGGIGQAYNNNFELRDAWAYFYEIKNGLHPNLSSFGRLLERIHLDRYSSCWRRSFHALLTAGCVPKNLAALPATR